MSANYAPQAQVSKVQNPKTIDDWLSHATHEFKKANIPTARLDAEVLLGHMLGVDRAWLIAHADESLTLAALSQKGGTRRMGLKEYGEKLILQRLKRMPIAYLVGKKEFYGRDFIVTPDVLIPRPETEAVIELLIESATHLSTGNPRLLDVGTGSGIIGITAKLEIPRLNVTVSDISPAALEIARKNGSRLKAKPIRYVESDILEHWLSHENPKQYDIITANLPYVDTSWERSPETKHEPASALFANQDGLEFINTLIDQSGQLLSTNGLLLLEADPSQHDAITRHGAEVDLSTLKTKEYAILLQKR